MAANSQELKYVFRKLLVLLQDFAKNILASFLLLSFPLLSFCILHEAFLHVSAYRPESGALLAVLCCKKHVVSVSLNPQVPNTWLWWIRTCDWELCIAQKVAEKSHCNWAPDIRCTTFRQMVEVALYAANMLHFLSSCADWFIWLQFPPHLCIPYVWNEQMQTCRLIEQLCVLIYIVDLLERVQWNQIGVCQNTAPIFQIFNFSLSSSLCSLSGCPRARKGGLKLTPNKDEKDEQELK